MRGGRGLNKKKGDLLRGKQNEPKSRICIQDHNSFHFEHNSEYFDLRENRKFGIGRRRQCDQMVSLFFNIWPFAKRKIILIISQICQSRLSILPNKN